jgi:hypothetical protein
MPEAEEIDTKASTIRLRPDGILHEVAKEGARLGLSEAELSVSAYLELTGGELAPLLVDARRVHAISREARRYLSGPAGAQVCSAVAILVGSALTRVIGNFFTGLNRPDFPVKVFTDEAAALDWLTRRL